VRAAIAGGVDVISKAFEVTDGSLSDLKGRVSQAIVNSKRHLVVMIDDVDRLDKGQDNFDF
jgi:replication-associated recombination protein RarA